jgi:hypothetical protein
MYEAAASFWEALPVWRASNKYSKFFPQKQGSQEQQNVDQSRVK